MGRIAQALKRAQEERDRRCAEAPGPVGVGPIPGAEEDVRAKAHPPPGSPACDVLGQASILETPTPPRPVPVQASPILPELVDQSVLALHDPAGDFAEKYRSVRTRILTANPAGSARAFVVTSTVRGEGKTVTTSNLGFSMAELRHLRVAMIDLDFRQRGLSRQFQADGRPGIADVLRGEKRFAEVCLPVVRENLFLVPAGDTAQVSPSELLVGSAVAAVFRELNERFHYSLIDTPPVHTAADVGLIAPLCHAVLMVIRMNRTPESLLCRCVKMLQANRVSIAGCILAGYREGTLGCDSHDYYEPGP